MVTPDANPRRQSVEYRWRWPSGVGAGVGHVHFMLFMSISFASGTQRKLVFQWNMGFSLSVLKYCDSTHLTSGYGTFSFLLLSFNV